jgi:hypothetical protein
MVTSFYCLFLQTTLSSFLTLLINNLFVLALRLLPQVLAIFPVISGALRAGKYK